MQLQQLQHLRIHLHYNIVLLKYWKEKEIIQIQQRLMFIALELLCIVLLFTFTYNRWQMFSNKEPFEKLTPVQLLTRVLINKERPSPMPSVPKILQDLINKCWSQSTEERPDMFSVVESLAQVQIQISSEIPSKPLPENKKRFYGKKYEKLLTQ